jgi:hypothetical protein
MEAFGLNENWFLSLDDAKEKTEAWRVDYNEHRPHSALGNLAPKDFASSGRPDEALIFSLPLVQKRGAGHNQPTNSIRFDAVARSDTDVKCVALTIAKSHSHDEFSMTTYNKLTREDKYDDTYDLCCRWRYLFLGGDQFNYSRREAG